MANFSYIYMLEKIVTKAMNNDKRAIIELYVFEPELFARGSKTFTILEPLLYNANNNI